MASGTTIVRGSGIVRAERLQPVLDRRGGRIVSLTGDGALIEFVSAVEATRIEKVLDWAAVRGFRPKGRQPGGVGWQPCHGAAQASLPQRRASVGGSGSLQSGIEPLRLLLLSLRQLALKLLDLQFGLFGLAFLCF